MDIMAFAEHGQPYEYFHTLRAQAPVLLVAAAVDIDVAGFGRCRAMKMSKNATLMPRHFHPAKAVF